MVTAVQAAVVAAAAAWVIGVGVAVYVMLKAARLMSETSTTAAGLRERGDLLIERANAVIDRAGEQITRTEAVTASIEGVTATMSELDGRRTAVAPAATTEAFAPGRPLTWAAALVYGIRWALGAGRAEREGTPRPGAPRPGTTRPGPWPGRAARWPEGAARPPGRARRARVRAGQQPGLPERDAGRRAALTGRADGPSR